MFCSTVSTKIKTKKCRFNVAGCQEFSTKVKSDGCLSREKIEDKLIDINHKLENNYDNLGK